MTGLKRRISVMLLLFVVAFSATAYGRMPSVQVDSREWIRTWLLCGPFPLGAVAETDPDVMHLPGFENDFLKAHGGEANPRIKEGQVETFDGGSVRWFRHTAEDFFVNLDEAVSKSPFVLAYGYCEIHSPKEQVCILSLGSNDGGQLWLNGERVWDRPEGRTLKPDNNLIVVKLRKGRNSLLLKIEERGNKWGFCVRFLPFISSFLKDNVPLFSPVTSDDGKVYLRFLQPESVKEHIIKNATIELFTLEKPRQLLWRGQWSKQLKMPLNIGSDEYRKYILHLESTLVDSSEWSKDFYIAAGKRTDNVLFGKDKTDYSIVVGDDASESENWAAKELQYWLKEVSGVDFPIQSDTEQFSKYELVVGLNLHTKEVLGKDIHEPDDSDESFTYRNVGPTIVIWGGKQRGTMYGVMTFLERELGCRWYSPRVSVVPKKSRYTFDYLNYSESPGIRVRNDFYYEAFDPIWAARNKVNGAMGYREQPGGVECYWAVHTFYRFMPPSEFYDEHPEYYSFIDGKRIHEQSQLCLTNPDVFTIITERLKKVMRENPQYLIYSVSQNDWSNPCQCEKCQAIVEQQGSEAGPLIWFVNRVAEQVEDEFPDKFVGTLAYTYTRKPCKTIRPRHNVVIRLCSIECCFAHDFLNCPKNMSFIDDLKGWAQISPHLYIWDYITDFSHYILPFPNFKALQPNIRTFRDNKAIGIMEQGAYQSRGCEFAELRAYVIAKLLWDPECDIEHLIDDFMYGYYGRSGQYIRRYFDLLHGRLTGQTHIHINLSPEDKLFSDAFIRQAEAIFDKAEAVADNEEIRQRVELARLPIMYLKCRRSPVEARYYGTYQRFCEIVNREGITHYAESGAANREAFHKKMDDIE